MPKCYKQFMELAMKLENHYRDMQDMEFTIQEGKLYFLQLVTVREQLRLRSRSLVTW